MSVIAASGRTGAAENGRVAIALAVSVLVETGREARLRVKDSAFNAAKGAKNTDKKTAPAADRRASAATANAPRSNAGLRERVNAVAAKGGPAIMAVRAAPLITTPGAAPPGIMISAAPAPTVRNVVNPASAGSRIIPVVAMEPVMVGEMVAGTECVMGVATVAGTVCATGVGMAIAMAAGMDIVTGVATAAASIAMADGTATAMEGAINVTATAAAHAAPIVTAAGMRAVIISAVTAPTGIRQCVMAANITVMDTGRAGDTATGVRITTSSTTTRDMIRLAGSM